ncbi:recombination mediator RecR [Rubritalea marina]|uniref:recombination mediator RecR n=1 Tax=Rubritalea marina TaxID=361055 RepID=UPI000370BCF2|nr:recombination mediator RecR [Rubritalea marina]
MAQIDYPEPIRALIDELKRMPSVGPRSAERIAVWMIQHKKRNPLELASALERAEDEVILCPTCGFFARDGGCDICDDHHRVPQLFCVVEQATDVLPIERSGAFQGYYHCLGGKLSPLDNIGPADLKIGELQRRVRGAIEHHDSDETVEVILALSSDVEGEATSNYLAEMLRDLDCRVTRIAQGLPAGGGLEHADELTLMRALQGRR